eukprot:1159189-Pelagomonas_calceolata.AAC.2
MYSPEQPHRLKEPHASDKSRTCARDKCVPQLATMPETDHQNAKEEKSHGRLCQRQAHPSAYQIHTILQSRVCPVVKSMTLIPSEANQKVWWAVELALA